MAEKQPEFVVTDRRKFTSEGEVRPDVTAVETEPQPQKNMEASAAVEQPASTPAAPPAPPQPSAEEQHAQKTAYQDSTRKLDDMLAAAGHAKPDGFDINFQRIVESYYMTALMQLGAIRMEGEEPQRLDIIGARQTIDTLGILGDKTKGNLTPEEQTLLQNATFELRMLFLEVSNAIARQAAQGAPKPGGVTK
jgi:hypothetical protein